MDVPPPLGVTESPRFFVSASTLRTSSSVSATNASAGRITIIPASFESSSSSDSPTIRRNAMSAGSGLFPSSRA